MHNIAKSMIPRLLGFVYLLLPILVAAQSSLQPNVMEGYTFSYSIVETADDKGDLLEHAEQTLISVAARNGGQLYASWLPATKPNDAPFAGLSKSQRGLMFAWKNTYREELDLLADALKDIDTVSMVSNRMFEAIYLPAGLNFTTGSGFYVHREERYSLTDVDEAVRLSKEAWTTWEPHWGVTVVGLFRELGLAEDMDNLNRIVWYPSFEGWSETRNFTEDIESANRFRRRRALLIPDSGIAIATNRKILR